MRKEIRLAGERGVVLVVSLILLILITLFAVAAIRSSTTELQIAGNAQIRKELSAAAQAAIEEKLNSMADINNLILGKAVANTTTTVCKDANCTVTVCRPVCLWAAPSTGGSLVHTTSSTTEMTYWEIQAIAVDNKTDAAIQTRIEIRQGFRVRMPIGSCPATVAPTSPCTSPL